MVFMAQIEKVLSDSEASSSSADEKFFKVSYYLSESESESEYETLEYYNNSTNYGLFVNNDDDEEIFHDMNNKELNEQLKELIEKNNDLLAQTRVLKDQLQVKHVVIDTHVECQEKYLKVEAERYEKGIGSENLSYFEKAKDLRPTLYDEKEIINHDFDKIDSPFKQTSSLKLYVSNVILEKIIIDLEDEVVNLLEKEKANLETIESLKSKGFESSEFAVFESKNQNENDCRKIEKVYDKEENPKVIAPGIFKLNVSQCVSPFSMSKSSCDSKNVEIKLKRKRHLDTFSSVRRPKNSGVIWKKKGSSNTSNVDCPDLSLNHRFGMVKAYDR
nr:hypothetical protein [Tanacetum cinerariifolium]